MGRVVLRSPLSVGFHLLLASLKFIALIYDCNQIQITFLSRPCRRVGEVLGVCLERFTRGGVRADVKRKRCHFVHTLVRIIGVIVDVITVIVVRE